MTNLPADHHILALTTLLDRSETPKPYMLIGLMGSGKTVIGRLLAQALSWEFIDSDKVIETQSGLRITDIFDLYGEPKFREMERRIIGELVTKTAAVISVGGGAFCQQEIRQASKGRVTSIWLRAKPQTLLDRIDNFASRPLLSGPDPLGVLSNLHDSRFEDYQNADIIVETDGLSKKEAVTALLSAITEYEMRQTNDER